jgi:hypothetical protein
MRRVPFALPVVTLVLFGVGAPRAALAGDPPAAAPAGPTAPADRLTLATERVVVFKDGYGLFAKSGTATADADGHVFTDAVPDAAVLGCFWAASDGRKVLGLHAGWVETKTKRERTESCLSVLDLLRANVNREVILGLTKENKDGPLTAKGTLLGLLEAPPSSPPWPGTAQPTPEGTSVVATDSLVGGTHVLLDAGGTRLVMPVAEVRTVSAADLITTIVRHETLRTRTKRLTIDLGKDAAGQPARVQLFYFTAGVRWIPTYRISGALEKDAEMALSGEVINDVEDVADSALDLVVGVPSFRFNEVVSPLSLESVLVGAMNSPSVRDSRRGADRQLRSQMAMSNSFRNDAGPMSGAGPTDGSIAAAPELATEALQDLFVYSLPHVTIRKGDRAALALWQSTAPVRHVYTADVVVIRNHRDGEAAYRSAKDETDLSANPQASSAVGPSGKSLVWHELELSNKSAVPWTTGAALVTRGPLPISQNILGYTSPGATTKLPLTVAVDVQAKWAEVELERRPRAVTYSEHTMTVVNKRGTLTIVNRRKDASPARITVSLGGKAETASDDGRITINDGRRADWAEWPWSWWGYVTNHSDIAWDLTLAPGETKTLTVEFTFPLP